MHLKLSASIIASLSGQVLAIAAIYAMQFYVSEDSMREIVMLLGLLRVSTLACGLRLEVLPNFHFFQIVFAYIITSIVFSYLIFETKEWHGFAVPELSIFTLALFYFSSTLWNFASFRVISKDLLSIFILRLSRPLLLVAVVIALATIGSQDLSPLFWISLSFLIPALIGTTFSLRVNQDYSWSRSFYFSYLLFSICYWALDFFILSLLIKQEHFVEYFILFRILNSVATGINVNLRGMHIFSQGDLTSLRLGIREGIAILVVQVLATLICFQFFPEATLAVTLFCMLVSRMCFTLTSSDEIVRQNKRFTFYGTILCLSLIVILGNGLLPLVAAALAPMMLCLLSLSLRRFAG
ncbi:MAG: hypothetical protein JJ934_15660 [Pseudomonadales bacterium]|nr:hypothetical protein [Pseudomonadales bacterium]